MCEIEYNICFYVNLYSKKKCDVKISIKLVYKTLPIGLWDLNWA